MPLGPDASFWIPSSRQRSRNSGRLQEDLGFGGDRAEAVADLIHQELEVGAFAQAVDAAVEVDAGRRVRHVLRRNGAAGAERDVGRPVVGDGPSFGDGERPLDEVAIEAEADELQVTGLLFAQQFARAAQIEVARRDGEAGAEARQLLQRPQTLLRVSASDASGSVRR